MVEWNEIETWTKYTNQRNHPLFGAFHLCVLYSRINLQLIKHDDLDIDLQLCNDSMVSIYENTPIHNNWKKWWEHNILINFLEIICGLDRWDYEYLDHW